MQIDQDINKEETVVSENKDQQQPETAEKTRDENAPDQQNAQGQSDNVKKLQDELAETKDKYLRLYSEFENFRRRTAKEKLEMIQTANEQLLKNLLPVIDDFDRAEKAFKDKTDKELEGFFLIYNKFKKILEQTGVKQMALQQGSDFNSDIHEAITQIPAPDETLKGKIVDVVEKGYLLNEKVIRFAKVVIGN
jgi:molecular chaperone GrpE